MSEGHVDVNDDKFSMLAILMMTFRYSSGLELTQFRVEYQMLCRSCWPTTFILNLTSSLSILADMVVPFC